MKEKHIGILYIILAAFCFACMSLFIKLAGDIPTFEKSFFRNLVAIFFALGIMLRHHIPFSCNGKGNLKYLFARAIGGTIGIFCNFYAIDHLVMADANMLNKLSPFFAIIFSFFFLREKIKPYQIGCVCLAFIGALFILKPGGGAFTTFPSFIGILGGLGAGFAYTFVRAASQHKVPGPVIVLFFSVFSCAACIPFCIADFKCFSSLQLFYMLCVGLSATGGQFAITAAYSHSPAREISVYDYTQILFAALFGILFFGEIPDRYSLLGYAIIILASVTIFVIQKKAQEKEKPV